MASGCLQSAVVEPAQIKRWLAVLLSQWCRNTAISLSASTSARVAPPRGFVYVFQLVEAPPALLADLDGLAIEIALGADVVEIAMAGVVDVPVEELRSARKSRRANGSGRVERGSRSNEPFERATRDRRRTLDRGADGSTRSPTGSLSSSRTSLLSCRRLASSQSNFGVVPDTSSGLYLQVVS